MWTRELLDDLDPLTWVALVPTVVLSSLALPDPLRTGTYRLEIISAVLQGLGLARRL